MIENDIKDRVPTYPGRMLLKPVEGMPNYFEIVRADEPVVEGTPLDRAAFMSIIHSRLTGRYYEPTVSRAADASQSGLTVSPIPTSGWVYDAADRHKATSGLYMVEVSSDQNTTSNRAADVFNSSGWSDVSSSESWVKVNHTQALKVYKIRFAVSIQYTAYLKQIEIQGSKNGSTWVSLGKYTTVTNNTDVEYTLSNVDDYNYYRIVLTNTDSNRIVLKNLRYTLYDVSMYINSYDLNGAPGEWTRGQRLMIVTPTVNALAVTNNYLNGVKVNTILQSGKRYELRYNGTSFDAKEV